MERRRNRLPLRPRFVPECPLDPVVATKPGHVSDRPGEPPAAHRRRRFASLTAIETAGPASPFDDHAFSVSRASIHRTDIAT